VESRWLKPFAESLLRLKRLHYDTGKTLSDLREALSGQALNEQAQTALADIQHRVVECRQFLSERLVALEAFDSRSTNLARRLYDEALTCRMRPFADGVRNFPRTVRDLGRALGKQARLELAGEATQVDQIFWKSWKRRWAICCATLSTTASNRRMSAAPPASPPKASSILKPVTAPACCRSSYPMTGAALIWISCAGRWSNEI
jgi:hypothetical protein